MTEQASSLLTKYFSCNQDSLLPINLKKWCDYQISEWRSDQVLFSSDSRLIIEKDTQRLIIRFIPQQLDGCHLLFLEEKAQTIFSIAGLELLGLTKREAEILFWTGRDKGNSEIAKIIDCREGTVRKHLEHIYKKLNVHTRAGAIVAALEALGLIY